LIELKGSATIILTALSAKLNSASSRLAGFFSPIMLPQMKKPATAGSFMCSHTMDHFKLSGYVVTEPE
jgi:hypothetical protein